MTRKQYRTAMGKTVDMGALMLQNEQTRAVGNMNVNARGDKLDSGNKVIDKKSHQIKRQTKKQVKSENIPVSTSNAALRRSKVEQPVEEPNSKIVELPIEEPVEETTELPALQGGLAAAIAKAKTVQQTKLPTPKQAAKSSGVKKI